MVKKLVRLVLVLATGGALFVSGQSVDAAGGGIFYESRPDEAALYLNDMAFVRDTVVLPVGQDIEVLLPPGTYADTLILTENGARVHNYRITPRSAETYYSALSSAMIPISGNAYLVTWEPESTQGDTREIKLEYLLPGASWTPTYDMTVVDNENVRLAFFAEVHNSALQLDETTVYLVAGRVDLSQQVDQTPMVTMNQYAVGYDKTSVELPALGVGSVDLQYVYSLGSISADPGDTVYVNLVDETMSARRMVAWNAAADQEVDVIYKVTNDTEIPWAEGIVRTYQDNLFRGSDFIETTPIGSEGSVTVGSMPDVRVHRTQSSLHQGDPVKDYYQHNVSLEIHNFSDADLDLIVLDTWLDGASEFVYSLEAERQQDNLLRWEVTIPAGESLTITYDFRTDY